MLNLILLLIVLIFVRAMLTPKQNKPDVPNPSSIGDIQAPTADAGRVVPVIAGTCWLSSPNVVWYGDFGTTEIRKDGGDVEGPCDCCCGCGGPDPSEYSMIVGYRYYIGLNLALCCGPIDAFLGLVIGDRIIWSGNISGDGMQTLSINEPNFFGGDDSSGGIIATLHLYKGSKPQEVDGYLAGQTGCQTGYPNICHVVVPGRSQMSGYIGTSTYMQPWNFIVKRLPRKLSDAGAGAVYDINGDANPVEFIFECMTDTFWGLGKPYSDFDMPTWIQVAQQVKAENVGMSIILDDQDTVEGTVEALKRYINASVFIDPATNMWKIHLMRKDYDINALPHLDTRNVVSIKMDVIGWHETVNELRLNYTQRIINMKGADRYAFRTRTVTAVDIANYFIQEEVISSTTVSMPALSNEAAAQYKCNRSLTEASLPLTRIDIKVNRECYDLFPGAAFVLDWDPYLFVNRVFRVVEIEYGELVDSEISIQAIEDLFSISEAKYTAPTVPEILVPSTTSWVPTPTAAAPLEYLELMEMPYVLWQTVRVVAILAARPNGPTDRMKVFAKLQATDSYTYTTNNAKFMPLGTLVADYPANTDAIDANGFIIKAVADVDGSSLHNITAAEILQSGKNGAFINGEMLTWQNVSDLGGGQFKISNVVRGCADTVPVKHNANSRVWICSFSPGYNANHQEIGANITQSPAVLFVVTTAPIAPPVGKLTSDTDLFVKVVPGSVAGYLAQSAGKEASITTRSRAWRPLPPGRIRVNTQSWPTALNGELVVTWAYREKLFQVSRTQDDPSDALESNVTFNVDVYKDGNLGKSYANLNADTVTIPTADIINAFGVTAGTTFTMRLEIYAIKTTSSNALESWQRQVREFSYTV